MVSGCLQEVRESGDYGMTSEEAKQQKAKNLRYKKPIAREMNLDFIREQIWNMGELISDVQWFIEHDQNTMSKQQDLETLGIKTGETCEDAISRRDAIEKVAELLKHTFVEYRDIAEKAIGKLPSVQPEPLSDAYMNAVWTWLIDYQIKAAELKGRYTPYEVLSWVANDWRKEHERFNQQTGGD